ncbi:MULTISPECIES: hypothetical protein [Bacillus]|nr:hypothetical protein [Bacillus cereus]MCC3289160.1 hypothetical protein [Bacillus cereus]WPD83357.1 hypothetical protein R8N76_28050 [Bacillus cereus ATCC 14579]SPT90192.1 Uncharacterised protein [Bacillus cereus]
MNLFSPKWWINMFITTFVTMIFIYLIKKVSGKYNVPFVKTIAEEV